MASASPSTLCDIKTYTSTEADQLAVPGKLCRDCFQLLTQREYNDNNRRHRRNYATLLESISNGCRLCAILYDAWLQNAVTQLDLPVNTIVQHANFLNLPERPLEFCTSGIPFTSDDPPTAIGALTFSCFPRASFRERDLEAIKITRGTLSVGVDLVKGRLDNIAGRVISADADLQLCRRWIMDCFENHTDCPRVLAPELPTRIIDVGANNTSDIPKLVLGVGRKAQYFALSHCWGQKDPLVTTRGNLKDHLRGIEWATLPKSFQDAIHVVRNLGFQYLWIDSLCVLQDDTADWREQCPKMAYIYSNALATIAIAGAKDPYEGFLHPRKPDNPSNSLHILTSSGEETAIVAITPLLRNRNSSSHRSYQTPPVLATRAWAFQERLLSPRVLSFGQKHAYFECSTGLAFEGVRYPLPNVKPIDDQLVTKAQLLANIGKSHLEWYSLVRDYSKCMLKYSDDKLPALAGLADVFKERLQDEYCVGLWKRDIVRGLQWKNNRPYSKKEEDLQPRSVIPAQLPIPSWSWASCEYPVRWISGPDFREMHLSIEVEVVDILNPDKHSHSSLALRQELIVVGKLRPVAVCGRLFGTPEITNINTRESFGVAWLDKVDWSEIGFPLASIWANDYPDVTVARKVECLVLCKDMAREERAPNSTVHLAVSLLLEEVTDVEYCTGNDIATFRRVGLAVIEPFCGNRKRRETLEKFEAWFDVRPLRTIRII